MILTYTHIRFNAIACTISRAIKKYFLFQTHLLLLYSLIVIISLELESRNYNIFCLVIFFFQKSNFFYDNKPTCRVKKLLRFINVNVLQPTNSYQNEKIKNINSFFLFALFFPSFPYIKVFLRHIKIKPTLAL